jgi:hypothetical protein
MCVPRSAKFKLVNDRFTAASHCKFARKSEKPEHKKARSLEVEREPPVFRIFLRHPATKPRRLAGKALVIVPDLFYSNFTSVPAFNIRPGMSRDTLKAPDAETPPRRP